MKLTLNWLKNTNKKELISLICGYTLALILVLKGEIEFGKDIAIWLIGYSIGRSVET